MRIKPWRCQLCGQIYCHPPRDYTCKDCVYDEIHQRSGRRFCTENANCECDKDDYIRHIAQQQFEIDRLNMNISRGIEWYMNYQGIVNDNDWRVKQLKRSMGRS